MTGTLAAVLVDELVAIVGSSHVLTADADRAGYEQDWTGRFTGRAAAVVRPADVAEVAAVLDVCRRQRTPLVAQGGNTGLVGGGVPRHGEVLLSLRRLDRIEPVDTVARQVTAGAGATLAAVQARRGRPACATPSIWLPATRPPSAAPSPPTRAD